MRDECMTIVIVDDDAGLLDALRFSFAIEGYTVRSFQSAEALLAISDMPIAGCLVVDYRLPGVDGLELLRLLRLRGVTLPAILVTTPPASVTKRVAQARVPVIEKPILTDALFDKVRALLAANCDSGVPT